MTSKEIISRLKKEGWIFKGQTGSHTKWENPMTKKCVTFHILKKILQKEL